MPSVQSKIRSPLINAYLLTYNFLNASGWIYALFHTIRGILKNGRGYNQTTSNAVKVVQTLSLLETIHSAVGLTKGNPIASFAQSFGRLYHFWIVCEGVTNSELIHGSNFSNTLLISWSIADIIRFTMYIAQLIGNVPGWLRYLRYTAPPVLYPFGMFSEMALVHRVWSQDTVSEFRKILLKLFIGLACPGYVWIYRLMLQARRRQMRSMK